MTCSVRCSIRRRWDAAYASVSVDMSRAAGFLGVHQTRGPADGHSQAWGVALPSPTTFWVCRYVEATR